MCGPLPRGAGTGQRGGCEPTPATGAGSRVCSFPLEYAASAGCSSCMMRPPWAKWRVAIATATVIANAAAGSGFAAQINELTVTHRDDQFRIVFDAVVDAPAPRVYAVLSDYAALGRLNPVISTMSVDAAPDGHSKRVRSVIRSCIWFFCKELVQVEDVTEPDPSTITARIVPGAGDFESGSCYWRVTREGLQSHVHYEATRAAAFWIPPVIGPWAINRAVREHFEASIANLERLANQRPGS